MAVAPVAPLGAAGTPMKSLALAEGVLAMLLFHWSKFMPAVDGAARVVENCTQR